MGGCVGRCLPKSDSPLLSRCDSGIEFNYLVEDPSGLPQDQKRGFLAKLFAKRKSRKKHKKPVLELVDGILNPQVSSYSRLSESQRLPSTSSYNSKDIPLQCLDARALLARTAASTPISSLDLEWEHETLPISMVASGSSWSALPEDHFEPSLSESSTRNANPTANSESDWSRVSSANSLEWDNVPETINPGSPFSEMDIDTQLLLSEIERLTKQTLQETGKELFS